MIFDLSRYCNEIQVARSATQINFLSQEILRRFNSLDWSAISDLQEDIIPILERLVDSCSQEISLPVQEILEQLVSRYNKEVSRTELSALHALLAQHCFRAGSTSLYLHLPSETSSILPSQNEDDYFWHCSHIRGNNDRQWSEASIHAAIAFSINQTVERYRTWCLFELIAHAKLAPLPRAVWAVGCPLVDGLAKLFEDRNGWYNIVQYTEANMPRLAELRLLPLVRRALASFAVHWVNWACVYVKSAPVDRLILQFLGFLNYEELQNAGLADICSLEDGILTPKTHVHQHSLASDLLNETGDIAQKLFNHRD